MPAIADGGNIEGTQTQTIDQAYNTTANCLKPPSSAPPLCATRQVYILAHAEASLSNASCGTAFHLLRHYMQPPVIVICITMLTQPNHSSKHACLPDAARMLLSMI